ncbi:MAG: Uma2 family endonuclease [Cyanobacteria bacterium J06629_19]
MLIGRKHARSDSRAELPVEIIDGRIMPLPVNESLTRQIDRLKQQIQRYLVQAGHEGMEVRSHIPITIGQYSQLKPTLAIISTDRPQSTVQPTVHWALDIDKSEIIDDGSCDSTRKDMRCQFYAQHGIREYWSLSTEQVELRAYHSPTASQHVSDGEKSNREKANLKKTAFYQSYRLWHVGEQPTLAAFPGMTLQMQEPLPLYFFMRTATGHRTYAETMLPLQITGQTSRQVSGLVHP